MRYRSDNGDRYMTVQRDGATAELRVSFKTNTTGAPMFSGTWVYLTEKEALKVAAQILRIVSDSK